MLIDVVIGDVDPKSADWKYGSLVS